MRRHVQLEIERSDFIGYTAITSLHRWKLDAVGICATKILTCAREDSQAQRSQRSLTAYADQSSLTH
jgi:hypothetical protein